MDQPSQSVKKYLSSQLYFYPTNPLIVVAAAATPNPQAQIQIDTDADFEVQYIGCAADIAGAAQTDSTRVIPLVTLQLVQSGGNPLMPQPVALSLLMGDGRLPFILPEPLILPANTNLTCNFGWFAAATDYNLRLVLIGRKLYFN